MLYKTKRVQIEALVRTHLDYACCIWSPYKQKYKDALENAQRRAIKQINGMRDMSYPDRLKPAVGQPCFLASGDSGTVPAITCDCSPVAELLMRRRYFDLCVTASSRTMLTLKNNVSCSSRDCSTLALCRR